MIIKFTIPCSSDDKIKVVKTNSTLLFRLAHYQLPIIEEIDYSDNFYAGISIMTEKKTPLFNYFKPVNELPHPEIENYLLKLIRIGIDFTDIYIKALTQLDSKSILKQFEKLKVILVFLEDQINLDL